MVASDKEQALQYAIEITKVVCANPHTILAPDKKSADNLVEFIKTLQSYFESEE